MKTKLLFSSLLILTSAFVVADDKTIRDENGKIVATVRETATGDVVRDNNGQPIARIDEAGRIRDSDGKIVGKIEPPAAERPTSNAERPTSNGEKK